MPAYNRVVLIGNLAADPEVRTAKNGNTYANFPLAINRFWTDKNGERKAEVDYHRIVCWGKLADTLGQNMKKGMLINVEGKLHNRTYDLENGQRGYITEVTAETIQILDWKDPQRREAIAHAPNHSKRNKRNNKKQQKQTAAVV